LDSVSNNFFEIFKLNDGSETDTLQGYPLEDSNLLLRRKSF